MFKNKKSFTLEEAIVFAFAGVIFLATLFIGKELYASVTSEKDDGSIANFQSRLVPKIVEMHNNNKKFDYAQIDYFLGADKAVVGFNKNWNKEIDIAIDKPNECSSKACLCIFNRDNIQTGKPQKPCVKFDKVAYFLKDTDESVKVSTEKSVAGNLFYGASSGPLFSQSNYRYMILYGNTLKSKTQAFYLEKYQNSNGDVVFYFAPVNEATKEKIAKRKRYIDSVNNK